LLKIEKMDMTVNYIYAADGAIEYAIIPYSIWEKLKQSITNNKTENNVNDKKGFDPSEYRGVLSHLNLDIESELENMKHQWKTNI